MLFCGYATTHAAPPNVVLILTDNHSAWTLGCYGNRDIRTPHIDALAARGVRFTRAFASNAVCSPTRATFLTGLIPSQHGVHSYLGGEKPSAQLGPDAYCTIREFTSLGEILKEQGYVCGLAGKWHLGDSLNPQEGFSYWFTKTVGSTRSFFDEQAIWHGEVYREQRYFTDVITDHAVEFIDQNRERPFFLFLSYNAPYGLGGALKEEHANRHAAYYGDKLLPSFPRETMHPWLFNNKEFHNNVESMRRYAAAISGLDDGVGRVMRHLAERGLDQHTLVVFTADQGLCGGQHGVWGMGDHTRPITAYDEQLHVPLIWVQPGRISAGKSTSQLVSNYDFLPSLLGHLDLRDRLPKQPPLPGRDYSPALNGQDLPHWDDTVYFEYENTRMIRTNRHKLIRRHPTGPNELFDLEHDSEERKNIYDEPRVLDVQHELNDRLQAFFARHADPRYDVWKNGRSKAGRLLKE